MELKWNLTDLFKNDEEFYKEIENIKSLIRKIDKNIIIDENTLLDLLNKKWHLKERTNNVLVYGSLRYYKNINDENCIKLKEVAESFNNEVDASLKFIDLAILDLGEEKTKDLLSKNKKLSTYKLYIDNLFRMQNHIQDIETTNKIKENNNSINQLLKEYNDLLHDIEYGYIEVDGKEEKLTPSNFGRFISSRDRQVRKDAYIMVNSTFKKLASKFTNILNNIYKFRLENYKLEDYNSVLEKSLYEENINPEIIDSLIKSVNDNLPLIQRYLRLKSEYLEITDPHLYDFTVPLDNNKKKKYTIVEAVDIIKNALKPLGEEYLKIVDILLDGHIDAELDENKHQSITFSWHTYSFMNFRGAYIDLKNMIHEIGHIVNYYLSKGNVPYIYEDSTVFVGETASTVNEILLNKYLYKISETEEEKIFYLSKEIENYFSLVFKQTMYTEFENELYKYAENNELTEEILSQKYENIIKKYYGNDVIYDDVSSIEWTRLGHLFRWSYYPYKYATGLMIASVVVSSLIDNKTLSKDKYLEFLSSGSNKYSLDLLKMLDIDLTDSKIIDDGFKVLEEDINEIKKVLSKKH